MGTTTPDRSQLPPFLQGFALAHDAMARDVTRLPAAVERVGAGDGAAGLRRWFARFRAQVEHHHQREDDVLWPELGRRAPDFGPAAAALATDHEGLDRALAACDAGLAALARPDAGDEARQRAASAAQALAEALVEHLAREEDVAFGPIAAHLTAEGYAALERRMAAGTSLPMLAFELPWVVDGATAEQRAMVLAMLPTPLRVLHRVAFEPRYRRLVAPLAVAR